MERITVVIPVGPEEDACRWLEEAFASLHAQTVLPDEVVLIDDMHDLPHDFDKHGDPHSNKFVGLGKFKVTLWLAPWRLGVAHAFNMGVGIARNECVVLLGADDTLEPTALEACALEYEKTAENQRGSSYYALSVRYTDTDEVQTIPCGAAMVTKSLWRITGGFPPETASGASDAALISMFWNRRDVMQLVPVGRPGLYNYRRHDRTDTSQRGPWQGVILSSRDLLTQLWTPPRWGRYC